MEWKKGKRDWDPLCMRLNCLRIWEPEQGFSNHGVWFSQHLSQMLHSIPRTAIKIALDHYSNALFSFTIHSKAHLCSFYIALKAVRLVIHAPFAAFIFGTKHRTPNLKEITVSPTWSMVLTLGVAITPPLKLGAGGPVLSWAMKATLSSEKYFGKHSTTGLRALEYGHCGA